MRWAGPSLIACDGSFGYRFAHPRYSIGPGVASAVDEQILPGDISGLLRAEKRAIGAELGRPSETPCGVAGSALAPKFIETLAARLEEGAHMPVLRATVEDARQDIVDGDVAHDGLACKTADEAHKPRARSIGQPELGLRNF